MTSDLTRQLETLEARILAVRDAARRKNADVANALDRAANAVDAAMTHADDADGDKQRCASCSEHSDELHPVNNADEWICESCSESASERRYNDRRLLRVARLCHE